VEQKLNVPMGCANSKGVNSNEDAALEAQKAELKGLAQEDERQNGQRRLKVEEASQQSAISTSSTGKVAEDELQPMPTPSASSNDSSPATAVSTSPPGYGDVSGYSNGGHQEPQAGRIIAKHETTKRRLEEGDRMSGPRQVLSPGLLELGWEPSPRSPLSEEPRGTQASKLRTGQDAEISISDDDDEDDAGRVSSSGGEGFDMQRWKRFYQWNHRKPDDLLAFFWKRFEPKAWSLFCASYRNQDALFAPFQGENVIHGVSCRLEAAIQANSHGSASNVFGLLHTFADKHAAKQKVLGLFIVRGQSPPAQLEHVLDEEDWALAKAETQDPLVRDFVSGLLAPRGNKSALEDFQITCSRVI